MAEDKLLTIAFEALINSHLLTQQQVQMGWRQALGPVECIRYEYAWEGQRLEAEYFFVRNISPERVAAVLRDYEPADNHQLFVVADKPGLVASYMGLGLSFLSPPHYLMARALDDVPDDTSAHVVHQATKASDALLLSSIDGADPVMVADILDSNFQHYYVIDGQLPVAVARNARIGPGQSWVSHVFTAQDQRRKGLASALMVKLMADRQRAGDGWSLLLATEAAHSMYQRLGYIDLAPIINFSMPGN